MTSTRFTFDLQPALDLALSKRDALGRRLLDARRASSAAARNLAEAFEKLESHRQRIGKARDDRVASAATNPGCLPEQAAFIVGLEAGISVLQDDIRSCEAELRTADHRELVVQRELRQVEARTSSLEKLRDRRRLAWKRVREARVEARRDDDAAQGWWHTNRGL